MSDPHSPRPPRTATAALAVFALRVAGLLIALLGLYGTAVAITQASGQLDWTYIDLYLKARLTAPLLAILLGAGLLAISKPAARWLARDLD